jgi:hypothetical protein
MSISHKDFIIEYFIERGEDCWVGMFKGWTSLLFPSRISSKREIKNKISSTMIFKTKFEFWMLSTSQL